MRVVRMAVAVGVLAGACVAQTTIVPASQSGTQTQAAPATPQAGAQPTGPVMVTPNNLPPGAKIKVMPVTPGSTVPLPAELTKTAQNQKLHDELMARMAQDQELRRDIVTKYPAGKPLPEDVVAQMKKADADNTEWLKGIIQQYGWPTATQAGSDGSMVAFLIAQHTPDLDFQKQCLELVRKAVAAGEAPKQDVAYLLDRIRMREGKPQVYGTQTKVVDGKIEVYEIEDRENVDKRRQEIGLPPLDLYLQQLNSRYSTKPK